MIIKFILAVLFLPIILIIENFKASRSGGKKILMFFAICLIIGSIWVRGYINLYHATKQILYTFGITDKLTNVPTSGPSMLPTFQESDSVTLHSPYKFKPEKGDVVAFSNIETSGLHYLKRIIAEEGDEVLLENGRVKINGNILNENYVLNDASTYGNTFLLDCQTYTVPKNMVLVMGDNRVASTDSRVIGFVSVSDINGVIKTNIKPAYLNPQEANIIETDKNLDIALFIDKLNEKRREKGIAPLTEIDILSNTAQEKSNTISQNIESWKQNETQISSQLETKGYDFLLIQEIITMGNYNTEELTKHVLELYPYNQDFLSDKYFDIGVGVTEIKKGVCSTPVIVIILGWPTNPSYSQETIAGWDKDIEVISNLITSLKKLKTGTNIDTNKTQKLIDEAGSLLEMAQTFRSVSLEGRWMTNSESVLFDSYPGDITTFKTNLDNYLKENSDKISDPAIRSFLDDYRWANPEFIVKSNETKLLFGQGKYNELLESAQELLKIARTNEEKAIANYWMGLAYYNLKNTENAKKYLLEATGLDNDYAAPYVTLSAISFTDANYNQGLTYAQKCVELDPDYGWCHNNLGLAYAYLGQKDNAIKELEKAVELDPNSYVFVNNLTRLKNDI